MTGGSVPGRGERPVRLFTQEPGSVPGPTRTIDLAAARRSGPLVSCIMATRGRAFPARHAIACFQAQSYAGRELVVACARPDSEVERVVAAIGDPRIRFVAAGVAATVGDIRNAAIAAARGSLLCIWDDDDLSHPDRIAWQAAALVEAASACCCLTQVLLWWPERRGLALSTPRIWENSLFVRREDLPPYPSLPRGGDTALIESLVKTRRICLLEAPPAYCYVAHGGNLWGADHFEMLFAAAQRHYAGEDYAATIRALAAVFPMAAYEQDLIASGKRPAAG